VSLAAAALLAAPAVLIACGGDEGGCGDSGAGAHGVSSCGSWTGSIADPLTETLKVC